MKRSAAAEIARRRLASQQLVSPRFIAPGELVEWMGAVQAQEYAAAKWAVGLRLAGKPGEGDLEAAVADGSVLRTHALRGTWHFVAPRDLRWLLSLLAPRVIASWAGRFRELGLDESTFRKSSSALARAVRDKGALTRAELAEALEARGISTNGQRLPHLLARAELEQVLCSGGRRGSQSTWALVDDRAPALDRTFDRAWALGELARRYFRSRGPATLDDFAWWSGLTLKEAREALEAGRSELEEETYDGTRYLRAKSEARSPVRKEVRLLPAFDELLVAYRDRRAAVAPEHLRRVNQGGGILRPCVLLGGEVVGTWRREQEKGAVVVEVDLFSPSTAALSRGIALAAGRYGEFLGKEVRVRR